jgi:hypothetical protein
MGVQLFNHLLLPKEDEATLHTKMANQIHALCMQKGIDASLLAFQVIWLWMPFKNVLISTFLSSH